MSKNNIVNIKVRMNLEREEDREAWENLRSLDRKKYKSYSRAFIKAINHLTNKDDPKEERRKEQEELLRLIAREVNSSVHSALAPVTSMPQMQTGLTARKETQDTSHVNLEAVSSQEKAALMDDALDFVNGF